MEKPSRFPEDCRNQHGNYRPVALRVQFGQRDGLRFGKLHPYSHGPDDIPHDAVHKRQSFHPRLWMHASADYCQKQRKR